MTLRVMLVDDEPMALEGLQLLIDWQKEGFEVVACCRNGAEALAMLPQARPDYIMTDLYMPVMDGITLIRRAREIGFEGVCGIVSGYGDFEKARQALELGVTGYILKPIDMEEASRTVAEARKTLLARAGNGFTAPYQQALTALLSGVSRDTAALPQAGEWRLATWGSPLPIVALHGILKAVRETGALCTAHILDGREWLALCDGRGTAAALTAAEKACAACGRTLYAGDAVDSASALYAARKALDKRFDDYRRPLMRMLEALEQTVALRQQGAFIRMAADVQAFCEAHSRAVLDQATSLWRAACARQLVQMPERLTRFIDESLQTQDIQSLGLLTIRLLSPEQQRLSDIVKTYTLAHYAENLTLDGLAGTLGYNAAYLGRVFRDETGEPYRAYLTGVRMQKAAALLLSSDASALMISQQVGYGKYTVFLSHFKLFFGQTPEAYRRAPRLTP